MCGLVGIVKPEGLDIASSILDTCRDSLIHRGPDSFGSYQDACVYLGFRRLAILDLSPDGDQPMAVANESIWLVFNGEIYNFIELRSRLEKQGYAFTSQSDTEVLLYMYQEHGTEMFQFLNGMFAIAIYDKKYQRLILARDRMGKKPLFYLNYAGTFAFSSELRALRQIPDLPWSVNLDALGQYLRLGWIPNWSSIYEGVTKLPPGHFLQYDLTTQEICKQMFWELPPPIIDEIYTEEVWLNRIEELLWDAVRIRLRSDVPLGIFLSGGIDSSLVAAAASQSMSGNVTSVTIGFPDWEEDEWPIAQTTAAHLQINAVHRALYAPEMSILSNIMGHFDEPFADSSALPTALVCQAAREIVTVALSGDAGDELFAGYNHYIRAWQWRHLERIPLSWRQNLSQIFIPITAQDSQKRRFLRRLSYPVGSFGVGSIMYPFEDWVYDVIQPDLLIPTQKIVADFTTHLPSTNTFVLDQVQRNDLRYYMLNDILVKMDRMSMRHSLEVRSPFLDYRVVEMALQIPARLRVKNGQNKYLLRRLAERHLPQGVIDAPKRGFGIPLHEWLYNSMQTTSFRETLLTPVPGMPEPFMPGGAEQLWIMGLNNRALLAAVFRMLAYRWWSAAQ